MPLASLTVYPILGTKTNVPQDDPSLLQGIGEGLAASHDVGGKNFDLQRKKGATAKSYGSRRWSKTANSQATKCLGLASLDVGGSRQKIMADNGKVYWFTPSLEPFDITPSGVNFSTDPSGLYSFVQYGDYLVMSDFGGNTPYKWKAGDLALSKLINPSGISGYTEYKFRYLEVFQNRILGAYSDETAGDTVVRFTEIFPDLSADVEFPSGNQLYKPDSRPITGLRRLGANACYVYSEDSIDRLEYYAMAYYPFGIVNVVEGHGSVNHHSIVTVGNIHYFFNRHYGFVAFDGSPNFPAGGVPISEDIENWIADFDSDYYRIIVGAFLPQQKEICWAVPMGGSISNTHLFFYNILTKQWRREDKAASYVDSWRFYSPYAWEDLIADSGGSGSVWTSAPHAYWAEYFNLMAITAFANTDGHVYYLGGDEIYGSTDFECERIEPMMDFGDKSKKKLLLEIWFGIADETNCDITVWYRGGETQAETASASWDILGTLDPTSAEPPVIRCCHNHRFHQIKYGTSVKNQYFALNEIKYFFVPEGSY